MPSFTKAQILSFLDKRIADAWKGSTSPNDASQRFLLLKMIRVLVANDIITAAMINTSFTEWDV